MSRRRRQTALFFLCLAGFFAAVLVVFTVQQRRLNGEIDRLVSDNLVGYSTGQQRQAESLVESIRGTLNSVASMIDTAGLSPSDGWLDAYLSALPQSRRGCVVDYLPAAELRAGLTADATRAGDRDVLARLLAGERVITPINQSQRLGGSFFAVTEPVFNGGVVQGALRSRVNAASLTETVQDPGMFGRVISLVVTRDGGIVYSGDTGYETQKDILTALERSGAGRETVEAVRVLLEGEECAARRFERGGRTYYICVAGLGFNGWHIVNLVRSADVQVRSRSILELVVWSGVILILLTALAGCAIGGLALRQKRRLDLEQQRYAALSQFSDTVLFEYRAETDAIEFTPNARQRLRLEDLAIRGVSQIVRRRGSGLLHPDDRGVVVRAIRALAGETNEDMHYLEVRMCCTDGNYRWFGCQYRPIRGATGSCALVVGKLVDITDQRSREQMLLERAQKDVLTDIYNKSGERIISERLQAGSRGLFFMLDLDNFKEINDTCGHAVGDALLTSVGEVLKELFRAEDVIARVGGDEFVTFLSGVTDRSVAAQKARAILERVSAIRQEGDGAVRISASIGIAVCPGDGESYETLYRAADRAMYRAKQQGKAGFAFYQDE